MSKQAYARAKSVVHTPSSYKPSLRGGVLQRKCSCGGNHASGECESCKKKGLQRRAVSQLQEMTHAPEIVHDVLRTSGVPMDSGVRNFFETRFGHDFSTVRIHSGSRAADAADAVNATAFTVGKNIVFGNGRYSPYSREGLQLMGHELTHVVQQGFDSTNYTTPLQIIPSSDATEQQAEHASRQIFTYSPVGQPLPAVPAVARQEGPPDAGTADAEPKADAGSAPADAAGTLGTPSPPATTPQAPAPATTAPQQISCKPGNANACPSAPAKTVVSTACQQTAPVPGSAPPVPEPIPPLPVIPPGDFGGDQVVTDFVANLACCKAQRNADDAVKAQFTKDTSAAGAQADKQAKIDQEKAIADAVDKFKAENPQMSGDRLKAEIAKATRTAIAEAKKGAATKKKAALATVTKEDHDVMVQRLAQGYRDSWSTDYRQSMEEAVKEFGSGWQAKMATFIANKKKEELARLTDKPKPKPKSKSKPKGALAPEPQPDAPPPQPLTADQVDEQVEAVLVQARCNQKEWAASQLQTFKRGWMVGRREQVDFDTISPAVAQRRLNFGKEFKAPDVPEGLRVSIPDDLRDSKKQETKVAPQMVSFLRRLQALEPGVRAGNYENHGSFGFVGKGFSVDLTLTGKDSEYDGRGFYPHASAVRLLLNIDKASKLVDAEWAVQYNDFSVAEEVNRILGVRRVSFTGNIDKSGRLNWHGPAPLKIHFHLDYMPKMDKPDPVADQIGVDHLVEVLKEIFAAPQPASKDTKNTKNTKKKK
jgi:hypothetical protein